MKRKQKVFRGKDKGAENYATGSKKTFGSTYSIAKSCASVTTADESHASYGMNVVEEIMHHLPRLMRTIWDADRNSKKRQRHFVNKLMVDFP